MTKSPVFASIDPDLEPVLEELRAREPIFHTAGFGAAQADWERATAPDFWEVGASGRRYSRKFILEALEQHSLVDAAAEGWRAEEFGLRKLEGDTYLLTYTLHQRDRATRRATIWQRHPEGWRILYHQGTVVTSGEDDTLPA